MGKSYRFDPDGQDGFEDHRDIRKAKKMRKAARRAVNQDMIPAEVEEEEPFDVMATVSYQER